MSFKCFTISVWNGDWAEQELNSFLRQNRVLAVDGRWVDQGANSFWAVWVEFLESAVADGARAVSRPGANKKKVDYKELLSEEDFSSYLQLRDLRKALAAEDGVALYTVFTNDQLAQMVQRRVKSKAELKQIPGVGDARIEKYGAQVLDLLVKLGSAGNETSPPVDEPDH